MDHEKPGMTVHLNLLAEQADEALSRVGSFEEQKQTLAMQVAEVRPTAFQSFLTWIARRRSS